MERQTSSSAHGRDNFVEDVAPDLRGMLERAFEAGVGINEWRVIAAIVHTLVSYSRRSEHLYVAQLAQLARIPSDDDKGRKLMKALRRLHELRVLTYVGARGNGRKSYVSLASPATQLEIPKTGTSKVAPERPPKVAPDDPRKVAPERPPTEKYSREENQQQQQRAGAREQRQLLLARFEEIFGKPAKLGDAKIARLDAALEALGLDAAVTLLEDRAAAGASPGSLSWFLPALEDRARELAAERAREADQYGVLLRRCDTWFENVGVQLGSLADLDSELERWFELGLEPVSAEAKRQAWLQRQEPELGAPTPELLQKPDSAEDAAA